MQDGIPLSREFVTEILREQLADPQYLDFLAGQLWEAQRSRALTDAKNRVNTRYLFNGSEITQNLAGTTIGLTGGKGQFDIVNLIGATGWIDSATNARQVNFIVGSGGGFTYDYLVAVEWATEVAAARGVEGQTIRTVSGFTFKLYSTVAGAVTQAFTDFPSTTPPTIFVCAGSYAESVALGSSQYVRIFGSGRDRTIIGNKSGASQAATFTSSGTNRLWLSNLTIKSNHSTSGTASAGVRNVDYLYIEDCAIQGSGTNEYGVDENSSIRPWINRCHVSSAYGISLNGSAGNPHAFVTNCLFDTLTIGLRAMEYVNAKNNWFFNCTTGVSLVDGAFDVTLSNNEWNGGTTGILTEGTTAKEIRIHNNSFDMSGAVKNIDVTSLATSPATAIDAWEIYNNIGPSTNTGATFIAFPTTMIQAAWRIFGNRTYYAFYSGQTGGFYMGMQLWDNFGDGSQ